MRGFVFGLAFFCFALCDLIARVSFEHVKKSSAEAEFHRCCIIIVGWGVSNRVVPTRNLHFFSNNQTLWVCWWGRDKQIFSCSLRRWFKDYSTSGRRETAGWHGMEQDFVWEWECFKIRSSSGYATLWLPSTASAVRGPCKQWGESKEKSQISPRRAEQGPGCLNPETKYFLFSFASRKSIFSLSWWRNKPVEWTRKVDIIHFRQML